MLDNNVFTNTTKAKKGHFYADGVTKIKKPAVHQSMQLRLRKLFPTPCKLLALYPDHARKDQMDTSPKNFALAKTNERNTSLYSESCLAPFRYPRNGGDKQLPALWEALSQRGVKKTSLEENKHLMNGGC
jgi:hypothetical protein